ncbi:MAG: TolC family protein [Burkholderiales bacterium]|nr:TolC family protein [Burkholderiales bacterium]
MSIRQLLLYAVCLANLSLAAQTIPAAHPATAGTLSLAQVLEAAKLNATARISQQDLAAAKSDILSANRAPLPIFSAKATDPANSSSGATGAGLPAGNFPRRTYKSLGLDWTYERGGKRALRTEAAQLNAQAAQAEYAETQILQQMMAKDLYFDLLSAQERTQHLNAIAVAAEATANSAKVRNKAGDLSAQDMMRVEIDAERAMSDYRKSLLDEKRASLNLIQSLSMASAQTVVLSKDWPQVSNMPLQQSQSLNDWISGRPDVLAYQLRVQASQALLENAKALGKIDPTIGVSVDSNPSTQKRLTELRVQFPLQMKSTYDGEIGRASAQYFQAQTQWEQAKLNAEAEWQSMREAYATSMARHTIYVQDILPRAQKVLAQAELAYAKGAIPLVDLLDARRTLKTSLLEALEVQAEHAKTFTALQLRAPKP